ncbi:MAG TPA: amidase [Xanthobacteraceae bacterium]|nr:amidase [Xanthobacteraceae bacterium]
MRAGRDLAPLSATETVGKIAGGELSSEQAVTACLERIAARDPEIRAFVHLDPEHALAQARACDDERRRGRPLGPLHGVPVAIKDIFDTADFPTENGSPLFAGRKPERDATVVAKLRAAGAVILGKTVTTECAFYHPGPTRNPHDLSRTPGGSSSGSAAAVTAGMAPVGLGSQTNGSVIRPAAFCGVIGFKPSHGLVSRAGALALSRRLDHVGVFARTLADAALVIDVLAGPDLADPDTREAPQPGLGAALRGPAARPRIAFVRTPIWEKADPAARIAFEAFADRLDLEALDLPAHFARAWDALRMIMSADMARNLGPAVERGGEGKVSKVLGDFLAEGNAVSPARYEEAVAEAGLCRSDLARALTGFDALLTPATVGVAPPIATTGDPAFCSLWTLAGVPAVSLPILPGEGGLPLGVQLVAAHGEDARLLRAAQWLLGATSSTR